ncbi:hypothetical protein A5893_06740 [Pedobacter psychrophilus]|uniref:Sensor of ECF-type sigma factor n=1 Tax=Pedobacter psychrophilus TaxID=1826909 RepID=A0A179DIB9_9SPHI|nr:hypothetical protein [Pedobacter psychrophilus]OAQ40634.1 hypothetical protein A5893_06740 [Pedobacter psychrophilus]
MKNKIYILFIALGMFFSLPTNAQNGSNQNKAKQIDAIKIGYLTRRLDLSTEESQKFWPVYNQYQQEMQDINRQRKAARAQNGDDANKLVDDDFRYEDKILDLKKKYRNEFKKVLSPEKIKSLYVAERDFREELIKQLKNRRENN